jgi:hypothetical protein
MLSIRILTVVLLFMLSSFALAHPAHEASAMDSFLHSIIDFDHLLMTLRNSVIARIVFGLMVFALSFSLVILIKKRFKRSVSKI